MADVVGAVSANRVPVLDVPLVEVVEGAAVIVFVVLVGTPGTTGGVETGVDPNEKELPPELGAGVNEVPPKLKPPLGAGADPPKLNAIRILRTMTVNATTTLQDTLEPLNVG